MLCRGPKWCSDPHGCLQLPGTSSHGCSLLSSVSTACTRCALIRHARTCTHAHARAHTRTHTDIYKGQAWHKELHPHSLSQSRGQAQGLHFQDEDRGPKAGQWPSSSTKCPLWQRHKPSQREQRWPCNQQEQRAALGRRGRR